MAATNTASNADAVVAGGLGNTVVGAQCVIAGGNGNTAAGTNTWVPGGRQANTRAVLGRGAWSAGQFAASGDAQAGEHVLRRQTTDATAGRLTADTGAPTSTNIANLPGSATYLVRLMVAERQTSSTVGTAGDSAGWEVTALIRRGTAASTTVLVGGGASITPTLSDAGAAAWRLAVQADTTNGGIAVSGTGEAGKSILWVARLLSVETVG